MEYFVSTKVLLSEPEFKKELPFETKHLKEITSDLGGADVYKISQESPIFPDQILRVYDSKEDEEQLANHLENIAKLRLIPVPLGPKLVPTLIATGNWTSNSGRNRKCIVETFVPGVFNAKGLRELIAEKDLSKKINFFQKACDLFSHLARFSKILPYDVKIFDMAYHNGEVGLVDLGCSTKIKKNKPLAWRKFVEDPDLGGFGWRYEVVRLFGRPNHKSHSESVIPHFTTQKYTDEGIQFEFNYPLSVKGFKQWERDVVKAVSSEL